MYEQPGRQTRSQGGGAEEIRGTGRYHAMSFCVAQASVIDAVCVPVVLAAVVPEGEDVIALLLVHAGLHTTVGPVRARVVLVPDGVELGGETY